MRNKKSTLLYRWFEEVWNQNKEDSIDKLLTEKAEAHGILTEEHPKGATGFKIYYNNFKQQFADVHVDVKEVVSEDDIECALTEVTARHIESGKKVKFSGMCMVKVEKGKIAEAWNHYDFLSMYQQLGHVLTPPEMA